jgi:hypothetical protein
MTECSPVAKRDQAFSIWNGLSWLFLDLPSRYTVDVWRTVWISAVIMLCFSVLYVWVLRRLVRSNWKVEVVKCDAKSPQYLLSLPCVVQRNWQEEVEKYDEKNYYSLRRLIQSKGWMRWTVKVAKYDEKKRTFRIRLFEPIHHKDHQGARDIMPWRDAAALSIRSFTKIGLGTSYPNTSTLKVLTNIEWVLGVYMLIHFILAVKNNLPFIAPFLGVVN